MHTESGGRPSGAGLGRRGSNPIPLQSVENLKSISRQESVNVKSSVKMPSTSDTDAPLSIQIRTEPFSDTYIVEAEVGRGKFASVKRCRNVHTDELYAAKFLRKRRKGKDCRAELMQEVSMLERAFTHPRLVDLVQVYETSHHLILVTQYAKGGELYHHIVSEERLSEPQTIRLLRQILDGLIFLHERNIVHLDIKPQNILLTSDLPDGDIKLCDFGCARTVNTGIEVRDILGTPDYVTPEVLSYDPIHTASDLWSVGVLTYVMLTGCSPFAGDNKQETFLNISQVNLDFPDELFEDISQEAQNFIKALIIREPSDRLTAQECLHHPWLLPDVTTVTPKLFGSPVGCRRALSPPSPGTTLELEEPSKKCRCDADESWSDSGSITNKTPASLSSSVTSASRTNPNVLNTVMGSGTVTNSATTTQTDTQHPAANNEANGGGVMVTDENVAPTRPSDGTEVPHTDNIARAPASPSSCCVEHLNYEQQLVY